VLGAPLIIGSDIRNLSSAALRTLSNEAAIRINQDALAARPFLVSKGTAGQGWQVWARPLSGGDVAVALLNLGDAAAVIEYALESVCEQCSRGAMALDVWTNKTTAISSGSTHQRAVSPHSTTLLRLKPAPPVRSAV
jgi:alpha-galactosidase